MAYLATDSNSAKIQVLRPSGAVIAHSFLSLPTSATIGTNIAVVRLVATQNCHYSLTGEATTSSTFLPAGTIEYIRVETSGESLSVIQADTSGTLYITEME